LFALKLKNPTTCGNGFLLVVQAPSRFSCSLSPLVGAVDAVVTEELLAAVGFILPLYLLKRAIGVKDAAASSRNAFCWLCFSRQAGKREGRLGRFYNP
jgi:hypothetical protein